MSGHFLFNHHRRYPLSFPRMNYCTVRTGNNECTVHTHEDLRYVPYLRIIIIYPIGAEKVRIVFVCRLVQYRIPWVFLRSSFVPSLFQPRSLVRSLTFRSSKLIPIPKTRLRRKRLKFSTALKIQSTM